MTKANLSIEVYVYCPKCENSIDLLDGYDDEGEVMNQTCPTDGTYWGDAHRDFEIKNVHCDECDHEFTVKGIEY